MNDIQKLFSIFTPKQLKECYLIFLVMLIGAVLESIGVGAILPLISLMGQEDFLSTHKEIAEIVSDYGIQTHSDLLMVLSLCFIAIFVFKNLYISAEIALQRYFSYKYQAFFSRELFNQYLRKPYIYHVNTNTATILRNVNNGAFAIFVQMLMPAFTILTEVFTMVAISVTILLADPVIAISSALTMGGLIFAVTRTFRKVMVNQGVIQNKASEAYIKWMNQGLGAIKETKILHKESFFLDEFDNSYRKYAKAVQKYSFINDLPRVVIEGLIIILLFSIIILKIHLGSNPMDIIPILGLLAFAAFRLMPSANRIISYMNAIKNQMPFFDELYPELMEIKGMSVAETKGNCTSIDKKLKFHETISLENVAFNYPESEKNVLDGVSFEIPKGAFVGVVGPSGSGKTTFVDILLGLLKPTQGTILCDGEAIHNNLRGWQANLAYVPQDIYLIDGTIKENIALGVSDENIDDKLIEKVLGMAELQDYVGSLPKGIDTFAGERGVKLSGGQRQRIGIARALYQQPDLIVLDEATSALDNETEKSITDTILKLKGQITIIAIAHRVSTLEQCDFKIKFENGTATRVD